MLLKTLLYIFLLPVVILSCTKKDGIEPSLIPSENFGRANVLTFYFYDEDGNNLVKKYGGANFKLAYTDTQSDPSFDYSKDITAMEDKNGEQHLQIFFRGFKKSLNSNLQITLPGHGKDKMNVKWWLTNKDVVGGPFQAQFESIHYNDEKVYSETDKKNWTGAIVVTKGKDKTSVATARP